MGGDETDTGQHEGKNPPILQGSVDEPLNREPPISELVSHFITSSADDIYDRNHGPIPLIDASTHRVSVDGNVSHSLSLSITDLATDFPQHDLVCALQCAGNRRHTMRTRLHEVDGLDWGDGAVMNCHWRGPRLRDILLRAGVNQREGHVAFACYQVQTQEDTWYGASIELWRALSEERDVILALEQNNAPLTPKHGAPVRVIVPGVAGARSVKWLDGITIQTSESANHYQRRDYKVLPEHVADAEQAEAGGYWDVVPAMQDMPLTCVITAPRSEETVARENDGMLEVRGYAVPHGAGGPIVKVEVSTDQKGVWTEAELDGKQGKWTWALWRARIPIAKGEGKCVYARATDAAGFQQPPRPAWNLRGVGYNGYGESRGLAVL